MEYQETINVDIENIAIKRQPFEISIYEVIDDSYSEEKLFPTTFLNQCRNNLNELQNIPSEVKASFLKMAMEKVLYTQVFIICQRESDNKKGK